MSRKNAAKIFRRENEILFSESDDSDYENSENDDSENEENPENDENEQTADPEVADLRFEKSETEHTFAGRPSKLRGATNKLPRAEPIPENAFSNERALMDHIYGLKFYFEVYLGTNEKAKKLVPNSPFLPISVIDIIAFFGHLLILWAFKPDSMEIAEFWIMCRNNPETFGLQDFVIFSRDKFNFINQHLDIGKTVKVPNAKNPNFLVIDLNKKLNPIIEHFNKKSLAVKTPALSKPLAVDESLRASHSRSCLLRQYMPAKPAKFGEKTFLLVDSDLFCLKLIFQFPKQFATYDGTVDSLMDNIVPEKLKNCGYTIIADNFFCTLRQVLKMQKESTAIIATMRSNRVKGRFSKATFSTLTKKPTKNKFERKITIFEAKTGANKYIQIQFYNDKVQKSPVIFICNDPFCFKVRQKIRVIKTSQKFYPMARNLRLFRRTINIWGMLIFLISS